MGASDSTALITVENLRQAIQNELPSERALLAFKAVAYTALIVALTAAAGYALVLKALHPLVFPAQDPLVLLGTWLAPTGVLVFIFRAVLKLAVLKKRLRDADWVQRELENLWHKQQPIQASHRAWVNFLELKGSSKIPEK